MTEITKSGHDFIGYEYKEVTADSERASMYLDGYKNFGWVIDDNMPPFVSMGKVTLRLKRDRKILNKAELTRLQRHFEACMGEIETMESLKTSGATAWALAVGILGTVFMAGSVFAVTNEPPKIALCIILAIPAIAGWILPYFVFKSKVKSKADQIMRLVEQKYDEIDGICEKGSKLC